MHLFSMKENARSLDFYARAGGIPLGRDRPFDIDGVPLNDYAIGFSARPFSSAD